MNEFDSFVKHKLKASYYIRYADDFVVFSDSRERLERLTSPIRKFLKKYLSLELHPNKIDIKTLASGIDFLGWIHFPDHRILRTRTRRRMIRQVRENPTPETLSSYFGLMRHGNAHMTRLEVEKKYFLSQDLD